MSRAQQAVAAICREWYRKEGIPLPVDLHLIAETMGIDTEALEESHLYNTNEEDEGTHGQS